MNSPWKSVATAALLAAACAGAPTHAAAPAPTNAPNPFFALCFDTHDSLKRSLPDQARLLKELGYDGAGHLWLDQVSERLQTLDEHGLKLFQVYLQVSLAPGKPAYDTRLKDIVPRLKGRETQLALLVSGLARSAPAGDARAVAVLREIATIADGAGLRVALYPHTGDWLESVEDALRVTEKVDRPNVGVMFNLCHWLRVDKQRNYRAVLEKVGDRLFAVSINGADEFDSRPGWDRYIQPLGRGSFDNFAFLKTLRELGYRGPIGLQCYGITGDARDHLSESMKAWRRCWTRLAKERY